MKTRYSRITHISCRIFIALIAIWVLSKYSAQFGQYRRNMSELTPLQKEKAQLIRENHEMQQRLNELKTPQGFKAEARRQGYIEPGERRIVFQNLPAPKSTAPPAEERKKSPAKSTLIKDWFGKKSVDRRT